MNAPSPQFESQNLSGIAGLDRNEFEAENSPQFIRNRTLSLRNNDPGHHRLGDDRLRLPHTGARLCAGLVSATQGAGQSAFCPDGDSDSGLRGMRVVDDGGGDAGIQHGGAMGPCAHLDSIRVTGRIRAALSARWAVVVGLWARFVFY
jgi:hypothetical protein